MRSMCAASCSQAGPACAPEGLGSLHSQPLQLAFAAMKLNVAEPENIHTAFEMCGCMMHRLVSPVT